MHGLRTPGLFKFYKKHVRINFYIASCKQSTQSPCTYVVVFKFYLDHSFLASFTIFSMISFIKSFLARLRPSRPSPLIRAASCFIVNECIVGDYYEFGVWKGDTFASVYNSINSYALRRLSLTPNSAENQVAYLARSFFINKIKYIAFDSFLGLPRLTPEDKYSDDFVEGQFACSESQFLRNIEKKKVPLDKVELVSGFYSETCQVDNACKYSKASLIWLDCDLYSSASDAFRLIEHIIQDGTILVIDDWFCNKGSPFHGVQKAFFEFSEKVSDDFIFTEYLKDSWKRNSFVVSARP